MLRSEAVARQHLRNLNQGGDLATLLMGMGAGRREFIENRTVSTEPLASGMVFCWTWVPSRDCSQAPSRSPSRSGGEPSGLYGNGDSSVRHNMEHVGSLRSGPWLSLDLSVGVRTHSREWAPGLAKPLCFIGV